MTNEWRLIQPTLRKQKNRGVKRAYFQKKMLARVLCETFLPGWTSDGPKEADHINRDPTDDRVENLRWLSPLANAQNKLAGKGYTYNK